MPCMSGIFRSSTIRSTGSIASRSMASRPLPACVDFTFRSEPRDVITMRLMVGESSTTKILLVLLSSGIWIDRLPPVGSAHGLDQGNGLSRGRLFYGKVPKFAKESTKRHKTSLAQVFFLLYLFVANLIKRT